MRRGRCGTTRRKSSRSLSVSFRKPKKLLARSTHIDITATVVELAGLSPFVPSDRPLDGKSFAGALTPTPTPVSEWRNFSFTEFYVADLTWWAVRHIDAATGSAEFTFHWFCSNQSQVFQGDDQWQMRNVAGNSAASSSFGAAVEAEWLPRTVALGRCKGTAACSAAEPAQDYNRTLPLACHPRDNPMIHLEEYWLDQ